MGIKFTNNAASLLASGITNVATSLAVTTGEGAKFPALGASDYFYATIVSASSPSTFEIVKVTARSTDTLTIVRAQEGTTAQAWTAGAKVELRITAQTLADALAELTAPSGGGTGQTSYTAGDTLYATGATTLAKLPIGTAKQALVSISGLPQWNTLDMSYLPDAIYKKSVKAATTANITLSGTQTIDGVAVVAGDRVLVKDQTTASQNGIYDVAAGAWTRSTDATTASQLGAAVVGVDQGTVNGGFMFDTDFKASDTVGTTAMNWHRFLDTGASIFVGTTSLSLGRASGAQTLTGVSIDGSADQLGGYVRDRFVYGDNTTGSINSFTTDGGVGANNLARSCFYRDNAGQFGALGIHIQHPQNTGFALQLAAPSYSASGLQYRYKNAGTWSGVVNLLDSANYNSYSPTLTGTGASGTWGISISGNAATATSAATLTTARTLTIGNTGKTFNGSANVSWTGGEIGFDGINSTSAMGIVRSRANYPDGRKLSPDEEFAAGLNGLSVYNNSGGTNVTVTRLTGQSNIPNSTGNIVRVAYNGLGTVSPGSGGFTFFTPARANARFITRFLANVPVGRNILFATNSIGTGGQNGWLTPNAGTGKWEEYAYEVICGTGTFGTTNFFCLDGVDAYTWDIASATVIDVTDKSVAAWQPRLQSYRETVTTVTPSGGTATCDLSTANVFDVTLNAATTALAFTNPPASGLAFSFTVIVRQDATGNRALTYPASVKFTDAVSPVLATGASKVDVLTFFTVDGGATYFGGQALANL